MFSKIDVFFASASVCTVCVPEFSKYKRLKIAKFNTASSGYEQEKARNALAQESLSLISDYNLSSDQYRWQEDGTLRIN